MSPPRFTQVPILVRLIFPVGLGMGMGAISMGEKEK